jgi:hypothetical protein
MRRSGEYGKIGSMKRRFCSTYLPTYLGIYPHPLVCQPRGDGDEMKHDALIRRHTRRAIDCVACSLLRLRFDTPVMCSRVADVCVVSDQIMSGIATVCSVL